MLIKELTEETDWQDSDDYSADLTTTASAMTAITNIAMLLGVPTTTAAIGSGVLWALLDITGEYPVVKFKEWLADRRDERKAKEFFDQTDKDNIEKSAIKLSAIIQTLKFRDIATHELDDVQKATKILTKVTEQLAFKKDNNVQISRKEWQQYLTLYKTWRKAFAALIKIGKRAHELANDLDSVRND